MGNLFGDITNFLSNFDENIDKIQQNLGDKAKAAHEGLENISSKLDGGISDVTEKVDQANDSLGKAGEAIEKRLPNSDK